MEPDLISTQVKQFINNHITSVAQLEMLLLLQTNPSQKWSADEIARELRTQVTGTREELAILRGGRLIACDPQECYSYAPASPELHEAVIALAQAYLLRRVTVIGLIFAKPPDSLRAFSDAFRLRKDPRDPPG